MGRLGFRGMPVGRLFEVLDADGSGSIDVDELLGGLARLTSPSEETLRTIFAM